ncbi:hypothetical protein NUSPORA_00923 [Nucleospora cyclopteri]
MKFFTNSGISTPELFSLITLSYSGSLLYTAIGINSAFLEFSLLVLPFYLTLCYFNYVYIIVISFAVIAGLITSFAKFCFNEKNLICGLKRVFKKDKTVEETNFKTNLGFKITATDYTRTNIIILVGICIFLADFSIFDSAKLGKQMYVKALKLMDIGSGCFTCNAGFVFSVCSIRRKLYSIAICLVFGSFRLITVLTKNVDVNEREFGIHLNFFYILAVITLIMMIKIRYKMILGLILSVIYEIALVTFLEQWILKDYRQNFFWANIEGFCFIIPSLAMTLIMNSFGDDYFEIKKTLNEIEFLNKVHESPVMKSKDEIIKINKTKFITNKHKIGLLERKMLMKFLIIGLFFIFSTYDGPFRRTHNMRYQMTINFLLLTTSFFFYTFGEQKRIYKEIDQIEKKSNNDLSHDKKEKKKFIEKLTDFFYITGNMKLTFLLSRNIFKLLIICSINIVINKQLNLNRYDDHLLIHLVNLTYLFFTFYIVPTRVLSSKIT